jgi:hypothetical protein
MMLLILTIVIVIYAVELAIEDTADPDNDDELQGCPLLSQVDYFGSQCGEEDDEVDAEGEGENSEDSESCIL